MKKNAEVRRYSSFADDFVTTKDQDHRLPEDYRDKQPDEPKEDGEMKIEVIAPPGEANAGELAG